MSRTDFKPTPHTPFPGSERKALPGAQCVGPASENDTAQVSVILRRPDEQAFQTHIAQATASKPRKGAQTTSTANVLSSAAEQRPAPLSREEYEQRFSAAPADIAAVRAFAEDHHLQCVREDACARTVVLSGRVAQLNEAFGIALQHYKHAAGDYRSWEGPLQLPAALHDVVTAVLGLDNRAQAHAHFRFRPPFRPAAGHSNLKAFTPLELASLYDFPAGDGAGQCIGIVELGGGYQSSDLTQYFSQLGIKMPTVVAVGVDGSTNSPTGDANSADGEVTLDIEVAGAIAPGAKLAVYFAPNSDAGFVDSVNQALHDKVNRPSVISISWGSPESSWSTQSLSALDDALQSAVALGVTVCVASGDSGSSDGVTDGSDHVDFPASSPYALACGGTRLLASANAISAETVWNDGTQGGATGGGVSAHFALPSWQAGRSATHANGSNAALSKRGVPDVAANADPETGYQIFVAGQASVVGGTSAVAPLWAALIARINATKGSAAGFVNPSLYSAQQPTHDITSGNNGDFQAAPGWDACTGLGSPDGAKLAALI